MDKKIKIFALIIILIIVLLGTMYLIDRKRMKNNKPVIFSTWGYSYWWYNNGNISSKNTCK